MALMAMRMNLCLVTSVVGSVQQRKKWFSQELEQTKKKKAVLVSVLLVKRKLLKEYDTYKLNKYNIINHV